MSPLFPRTKGKTIIKIFLLILTLGLTLQAREINTYNIVNTAKLSQKQNLLMTMDCGNYKFNIQEEL